MNKKRRIDFRSMDKRERDVALSKETLDAYSKSALRLRINKYYRMAGE